MNRKLIGAKLQIICTAALNFMAIHAKITSSFAQPTTCHSSPSSCLFSSTQLREKCSHTHLHWFISMMRKYLHANAHAKTLIWASCEFVPVRESRQISSLWNP